MRVKNFIEYILESKGISDICMEYKNNIWEDFYNKIKEILLRTNDNNYGNITYNFNNNEFIVNNLMIDIYINKYDENICNARFIGSNSIVKNNIFYNPRIEFKIYYKKFNKQFFRYIESILLHELLHCYQMYKLENKKMPNSWQYGSILSKLRNGIQSKNNDIDKIIDLIYYSLDHEINAQLHQYYDHILNGQEYNKIFDIKNSLRDYIIPSNINKEFIDLIKKLVFNYKNSLKTKSPNINFNNNKSLWSYDLDNNNIESFLRKLKRYFTNSANYLDKKIKQIDKKLENYEHIDYSMKLTEEQIFHRIII